MGKSKNKTERSARLQKPWAPVLPECVTVSRLPARLVEAEGEGGSRSNSRSPLFCWCWAN